MEKFQRMEEIVRVQMSVKYWKYLSLTWEMENLQDERTYFEWSCHLHNFILIFSNDSLAAEGRD